MENSKIISYLRAFFELKIYRIFYFLIFLYPLYEPFKYVLLFIIADVVYEGIENIFKKKPARELREPVLYHPNLFVQSFMQLIGIGCRTFYKPPKSIDWHTFTNTASFQLPFKGKWYVYNGGLTKKNSHSWSIYNQRYAYDFVMMDESNKSYHEDAGKTEDYYCFGAEVVCPADGKVIKVNDGMTDYDKPGSINYWTKDFRGNFLMIKHNNKEFSFIAHFKSNSIRVKEGQAVKQGELLGYCGNSGHSTEPHIHFHVQDSASFYWGVGVPIKFASLENGWLNNGVVVENKK
ncbi:M23 family metallopeptidase [Marivirga sp. S37H4]|uniref:M23 family metallopeptidase n=1 Tax=Marivirga aurantiaca TaxID=2802615 RepID=A0A935CC17_9BACT|nr:M23 family metallopeptidase [Marivirga aurantiaca]MBK6267414.1 M23 family metallopeptidase [Marivirga aurantiaca]